MVTGVKNEEASDEIIKKIEGLMPGEHAIRTKLAGDSLTVWVGPVDDLRAIADKIEFGRLLKVDQKERIIRVQAK